MIGRVYLLRGEPVTVLARWDGAGPRNVLLERPDGSRLVRPFRGLRRATPAAELAQRLDAARDRLKARARPAAAPAAQLTIDDALGGAT
jgi:hypothetical protein